MGAYNLHSKVIECKTFTYKKKECKIFSYKTFHLISWFKGTCDREIVDDKAEKCVGVEGLLFLLTFKSSCKRIMVLTFPMLDYDKVCAKYRNLYWKLAQQSVTYWKSLGLSRNYSLNHFLGIFSFAFQGRKLKLSTWKRISWNLTKFQIIQLI